MEHGFDAPTTKVALKAAAKACDRKKTAKSAKPITLDVLDALIKTTERSRAIDLRDAATLLVAFVSGGRRRAEVSSLTLAGYDPKEYSAHRLRSGFMTEARNQSVPLEEAMAHSKHRSYQVPSQYYKAGDAKESKALKIVG